MFTFLVDERNLNLKGWKLIFHHSAAHIPYYDDVNGKVYTPRRRKLNNNNGSV